MDTLICLMILILGILSGYLYCIGGRDKNNVEEINRYWFLAILPKWVFNGSVRDIGCTFMSSVAFLIISKVAGGFSWWKFVLFTALQFWACRSYFQWVNDIMLNIICGKCGTEHCGDCNIEAILENKQWWNWLLVGIVSSFKWLLVFPAITIPIWILKAIMVMYVSQTETEAVEEEMKRGWWML